MSKAPPKLTMIQAKALEYIRSTIESTGTSPTLRELCAFMGYSAIGSAQDLVAALRRKGFLQTPDRQSARSLVLTPKAIALKEPSHQSTETTYVIHCLDNVPSGDPLQAIEERTGTLRMSVNMFKRPFPSAKTMFALRAPDDAMIDAGILRGDWLVVNFQKTVMTGDIVVVTINGRTTVKRFMQDRNGPYLKSENLTYDTFRPTDAERFSIVGRVMAVQRVI